MKVTRNELKVMTLSEALATDGMEYGKLTEIWFDAQRNNIVVDKGTNEYNNERTEFPVTIEGWNEAKKTLRVGK